MTIHPTALVDSRANVHPTATIGAHAVVDGPVHIGADCRIDPFAVLLGNTTLGAGCRVHSHAVVGDEPQDFEWEGGESSVRIGNECILREGATVHRGAEPGSETVVGHRCMLMTNTHVGHNCVLGDGVTLISGALLGGYVQVGDRAIVSGNAAVHQSVRIGELAMISGLGRVTQDVPPYFMTNRDGAVVGVNSVGLIRAGLSLDERKEVKSIHREVYRSGSMQPEAIEKLFAGTITVAGLKLLEFLTGDSIRGLTRGGLRRRNAA